MPSSAELAVNFHYACESFLLQAQRNNEDVNAIEPLFSVNIDHRVSLVQTETHELCMNNAAKSLIKKQLSKL